LTNCILDNIPIQVKHGQFLKSFKKWYPNWMISFDLYLLDISEEYGNVIKLKVTDDSLVGNPYMFFPPLSNNLRIVAGINGIREAFTAAKMTLNTWTTISVRVAKNGISSVLHWSEKLKKLEIFQNSLNFFSANFYVTKL